MGDPTATFLITKVAVAFPALTLANNTPVVELLPLVHDPTAKQPTVFELVDPHILEEVGAMVITYKL